MVILKWALSTFFFNLVASTGLRDATGLTDDTLKKELAGPYSLYRKSLSWGDAQIFCEAREGHLASFSKFEDAKQVSEQLYDLSDKVTTEYLSGAKTAEFGLDRRYWIGLTDLTTGEGKWAWAGKGDPLTYDTMWYPGQPDHVTPDGKYVGRPEHCVGFWNPVFHKGDRRHSFVDMECKLQYYFICEKDQTKLEAQKSWKDKHGNKSGRGILIMRNRHHKGDDRSDHVGRSINIISVSNATDSPAMAATKGRSISHFEHKPLWITVHHDTPKSGIGKLADFKELFLESRSESVEVGLLNKSSVTKAA